MLFNYLKTALRNFLNAKGSALINLSGLTLGITGSLVLFLMIAFHSGFDGFHSKRDRIFRVVNESDGNQGKNYQPGVPTVLPDAFRNDFPEAEAVAFASYRAGIQVSVPQPNGDSKKYKERAGVVYTEPSFFQIFDRAIITGDASKALDDPNEAIVSKSWAVKYFGKEDAIGEVVRVEGNDFKIAAIMEDAPRNTDFPFQLMLSYATVKKTSEEKGWHSIWSDEQCYFLIPEKTSIAALAERMPAFSRKYLGENDFRKSEFLFQPLTEIHFDERYSNFSYNTVGKGTLITLGAIALILIITACINFINLATAEAIKRSKEVGVRKSLGSSRKQLVWQFLGETTLVTIVAVILSLCLTQVALSFLNPFLELELQVNPTSNVNLWIFLAAVTVVVSLLSGLYPAFVISGFRPALALKNQINNRNASGYALRRVLVVVQFCFSQLFIIGTLVIISQTKYFQSKELGFAKDAILMVPIPERETPAAAEGDRQASKMRSLRDEMVRVAGVQHASLNSTPPSSGNVSGTNFKIVGNDTDFGTQVKQVDGNYIDLFKLQLIAGENISDRDTAVSFVVNEKFARIAGFENPADIIGKIVRVWGKEYPVVGVVKDFHTVSLREPIEATILFNRIRGYETLALQLDMRKSQDVINELKRKWEAAYPDQIFEYSFLDQRIAEFYQGERRMSTLLTIFTSMAIFIGALGLFGLATFMSNQKRKEIGVRKVLGASVESIVFMFSKEFGLLILIGFVFAAPLGWFVANQFLSMFAYKITLGAEYFIVGLISTFLIAVVTVGYKSFRTATSNPVNSLRYE